MPAVARLLLASGDAALLGLLTDLLAGAPGLEVIGCRTGRDALDILQGEVIDLVLIGPRLIDPSATDLLEGLRLDGFRGPVIRLDTEGGTEAADPSTEMAACERIDMPFRVSQLLTRIRALIRAFEASDEAAVPVGPFLFRPGAKSLMNPQGDRLKLTEKETAILRHLHRAGPATVVTRDELLQDVFGYSAAVETHTLETHVYRLRQKIETDPAAARILLTEPGGYRLQP